MDDNRDPIKEAAIAVGDIMDDFHRVADEVGVDDAKIWLSFKMYEANGFVDCELLDAIAVVRVATDALTTMLALRFLTDGMGRCEHSD